MRKKNIEKALRRLFYSVSFAASCFAQAEVSKKLKITTKVNMGSEAQTSEIHAVFDSIGLGSTLAHDPRNPAYPVYERIVERLSTMGKVTKGSETGPGRTSIKVVVEDTFQKVPVMTGDQPKIIEQLLKIDSLIAPFSEDVQKSRQEVKNKYGQGPYIHLSSPSSRELTRFYICVGLEYQATIAKKIQLPPFAKRVILNECQESYSDISFLEKIMSLEKPSVQWEKSESSIFWNDFPEYWPLVDGLGQFGFCGALGTTEEIVTAGWSDGSGTTLDIGLKSCKFLYRQVVEPMKSMIHDGLNTSVLKASINPYYRSFVQQLLDNYPSQKISSIEDLQTKVDDILKGSLTIGKGFTKNEVVSREFNTAEFLKALQQPITDPNSLLIILLSNPHENLSPLRQELALSHEKEQYLDILKANLALSCMSDLFAPSCLYHGVSRISQSQIQISLHRGLAAELLWQGHYLRDIR